MQEGRFQGPSAGAEARCSSSAADAVDCLPLPLDVVVGEALRAYEARSPGELMALLRRRYDPSAEFVDPVLVARPLSELALARYALQKLYRQVEVQAICGTDGGPAPDVQLVPRPHGGPPLLQVRVQSWQRLVFARGNHISQQVLPEEARRRVTSTLLLDPRTALVLRHEDAWEPPHAALRLPRALRRLNCACSNAVYRLLGWEAELRAAQAAAPSWDA